MEEEIYYDVICNYDDDSGNMNKRFNTYEEAVDYAKEYCNDIRYKIVKITIDYKTLLTVIPRSYNYGKVKGTSEEST